MAQLTVAQPQHGRSGAERSLLDRVGDWVSRVGVPWLFLLPTMVFFIGWAVYPIIRVAWL